MEPTPDNAPLIVIVGETASGKSALAMQLAERLKAEIIAADSRTIYRHMDVSTAKPSVADQLMVPHHLLDVVNPDEQFTAADFKVRAEQAIEDIQARGSLPILVGGTGLYIDSVLYDFSFAPPPSPQERQYLQSLNIDQLQALLVQRGLSLPENDRNPRHLIRTLERQGVQPQRAKLRPNTLIVGIEIDRDQLKQKITHRVDVMVAHGLIDEVARLGQDYGWNTSVLRVPVFEAFHEYLDGNISLQEAKQRVIRSDMQLAKRQRTWFRRNKSIHWVTKQAEAVDLVTTFLNK